MSKPPIKDELEEILGDFEAEIFHMVGEEFAPKQENGSPERKRLLYLLRGTYAIKQEVKSALLKLISDSERRAVEKVDRFEVIDETGRAYVKGSIYGSPVSVELSYQDAGRTLKIFVKDRSLEVAQDEATNKHSEAKDE